MGGQFFGGGSGGGGGGTPGDAPGGAAGGDLSGTYPNPGVANLNGVAAASYALLAGPTFTGTVTLPASTVTSGMILDGTIASGDLNAAAGITSGQLAGSIAPSKITGTAVTAADTGTVTSAMILDGTIVSGDLNSAAGITSGQLAGSIAPSKITGTSVTAADTGTVTSAMILDGTIAGGDLSSTIAIPSAATGTTQTALDGSTKVATTAYTDRAAAQLRADYYLNGSSLNVNESFPRNGATTGAVAPTGWTTGTMYSCAVYLPAGCVVTNITFRSAGTGSGTSGHGWFALYSNAATPALLSQSADQTGATWWAAGTVKTLALGGAQTITTSGVYYLAVMVASGTMPNLTGTTLNDPSLSSPVVTGMKTLAQVSGSALTTTAPGTITGGTAVIHQVYGVTS